MKGFSLWTGHLFNLNSKLEVTDKQFRDLFMKPIAIGGFDTVCYPFWWTRDIEPHETQSGVWSESNLQLLESRVIAARDFGLNVILAARVAHEESQANVSGWWSTWQNDGVGMWARRMLEPEIRNRFFAMHEMIIKRFDSYDNVIGYCPWWYPFHKPPWRTRTDPSIVDEVNTYYDIITPEYLSLARSLTSKIILYAPYKQGEIGSYTDPETQKKYKISTGEYHYLLQEGRLENSMLKDPNVIYGHAWHEPRYLEAESEVVWEDGDWKKWDYDLKELEWCLDPAFRFKKAYNAEMMAMEFGLASHKYPDVIKNGDIGKDRLDLYYWKYKMLKDYKWSHSLYWTYNGPASGVFKECNPDIYNSVSDWETITPYKVVDVLTGTYLPDDVPPPTPPYHVFGAVAGAVTGYAIGDATGAAIGSGTGAILGLLVRMRLPVIETVCSRCGKKFSISSHGVPVWCTYCGEEQIVKEGVK